MASTDSLEKNTAFADKNAAPFPILSDEDKSVAARFGVLSDAGYASRWTYYIDPEGRIAHIDKKVNALSAGTDMLKILNALGVSDGLADIEPPPRL